MMNFDACQSKLGDVSGPVPKAKFIGKIRANKSAKVKKQEGRKGLVSYFIKTYEFMTADGLYGPRVECIADSNMPEDEIDAYECDGIGLSRKYVGDHVHIVFCKTRSMCEEFYNWYWEKIVLPFIVTVREDNAYYDNDGNVLHLAGVNCDGEDMQIKIFSNPSFQEKLKAQKVIVDKPSASTTEITQACDQELFKTKNNYLKEISDDDVRDDTKRFELVSNIFALHQNKYKRMKAEHVRMGIYGLLRLALAWQKTCTPERAVASFKVIGAYPFDPRQVLFQCTAEMTTAEETRILLALEDLTDIYDKNGGLTTSDFDASNIPDNDPKGKAKEDLIMSRQRTKRLTHPTVQIELAALLKVAVVAKTKRNDKRNRDEASATNGAPKVVKAYKPRPKKQKLKQN